MDEKDFQQMWDESLEELSLRMGHKAMVDSPMGKAAREILQARVALLQADAAKKQAGAADDAANATKWLVRATWSLVVVTALFLLVTIILTFSPAIIPRLAPWWIGEGS